MAAWISAHWSQLALGAGWLSSHLRRSLPPENAPRFWRTLIYNFVKGQAATEQKIPPG